MAKIGRPKLEENAKGRTSLAELDGIIVSGEVLGKVIGTTPQGVVELATDGRIMRAGEGSYPLVSSIRMLVTGYRALIKKHARTGTTDRVQEARAAKYELEVAQAARQLIPLDEAVTFVDEIIGGLKATLDGFPAAVTRDMDLRLKIETELNERLGKVSSDLQQKADALREGSEPPEAAEADAA